MRRLTLTLAILLSAGCTVHSSPPPQYRRADPVEDSHACVGACDHFIVDGGWYVEVGHKHGPNCGHVLVNGKWTKQKGPDKGAVDPGPPPQDKKDKE